MPARLVVLASGRGTTLQAVLDACDDSGYGAAVCAVVVDRPGSGAQQRAEQAGIAVEQVLFADYPQREQWDRALAATVARHQPDLVLLAGFMRILGASFLARLGGRTINTHPSLLPDFPGRYPVRDTLAAGVGMTGVTVHWVDAGIDTGPVIAQTPVSVHPGDTEDTLTTRIQQAERLLVVQEIGKLVNVR